MTGETRIDSAAGLDLMKVHPGAGRNILEAGKYIVYGEMWLDLEYEGYQTQPCHKLNNSAERAEE